MEREKLNKKQIIPLVIGILTLVILVSSATYAYFSVTSGKTASSTTITGDIAGSIGTVTLSGGGDNLYMSLSAYDMSESKVGTTYYASATEGSRETNVANAARTTFTAELTGDETDKNLYACDYEFEVVYNYSTVNDNPIAWSVNSGDATFVLEGDISGEYDYSRLYYGYSDISGTWNFRSSDPKKEFSAYFKIDNRDANQNVLAGTDILLELKSTKFECYLVNPNGEAYALYTESDQALTFVRSLEPIEAGELYNGVEVTEVYTGFETDVYTYDDTDGSTAPWGEHMREIVNVTFEDEIKPMSTSAWFAEPFGHRANGITIDLTNLNTLLVTDMSYMFMHSSAESWYSSGNPGLTIIGYENLNTLLVTDMSYMFASAGINDTNHLNGLDLSEWDVSNVKDMRCMFCNARSDDAEGISLDLSGWKTSNVTDMSAMFENLNMSLVLGDIANWDVSNVINMTEMFAMTSGSVDLSKWKVSNVKDMSYMFLDINLTSIGDISGWDTSNVENMERMFENWTGGDTLFTQVLDLSGWDVKNVTKYNGFTAYSSITPPNFNKTT